MKKLIIYVILFWITLNSLAVNNPFVEIYDGCIMRFGGIYYAMGTGTAGNIYYSEDLIKWYGPFLVAKSNEAKWLNDSQYPSTGADVYDRIGAGDIVYHNGIFHIYYNGIGHSVSTWPLKEFKETSINEPFCVYGIDPQLFIEDDGSPVFLRKVQTKHPITMQNWTQAKATFMFPLETPFSYGANPFTGDKQAIFLNGGEKGRNDHIDKNNFEGGELYKYRGEYHLLNSVNCMSARTGLYNTFCTQSTVLTEMGNEDKHPLEVLTRNLETFHRKNKILAPMSEFGEWNGKFLANSAPGNWYKPDFDDNSWQTKSMGIGAPKKDRDVDIRHVRTIWDNSWNTIYVRREFTTDEIPQKPYLLYRLEGGVDYYLNGVKLFSETGYFRGWKSKQIPASAFIKGKNVLAIRATQQSSTRYMDVGVYDAEDLKIEDPIIGPSQVNVVLAPNGFEHIIVYKAFWNGDSYQGIDRVFFYNKEMVIDGPTTTNTNGYHPNPSTPSIRENLYTIPSITKWNYEPSEWRQISQNRYGSIKESSKILSNTSATNYFIETTLSLPKNETASAGIIAWYKDNRNHIEVLISRENKQWIVNTVEDSIKTTEVFALPEKFMFFEPNKFITETTPAMHELRLYKNGSDITIWLDNFLLTLTGPIKTKFSGSGQAGIVQYGAKAEFNHIIYTKGWDEYGLNINDWKGDFNKWSKTENGLNLKAHAEDIHFLEKGDYLTNYNFECNVESNTLPDSGKATFRPIYIDDENFIEASLDFVNKQWEISSKVGGNKVLNKIIPTTLGEMRVHRLERSYTGPSNYYRYDLKGESLVSGIKYLWMEGSYPFINADFGLPEKVEVYYFKDEQWHKVENQQGGTNQKFSFYNEIRFDPVKTTALQITYQPDSRVRKPSRPYHIEVTVDLPSTFFFRSVRNGKNIRLFYNQTQIAEFQTQLPASKTAIGTNTPVFNFNGIMCYQNSELTSEETGTKTGNTVVNTPGFNIYNYNNQLLIHTEKTDTYRIELYDMMGKTALNIPKNKGPKIINLEDLTSRFYVVKLSSKSGILTKKIVL